MDIRVLFKKTKEAKKFKAGKTICQEGTPGETMYVVLDGEVTISNGTEEVTLRPWDSCRIAPDEPRALSNRTNRPATILLAMPLAPA